jgi:hypothetical protein
MKNDLVAGLAIASGRKGGDILCVLEYFSEHGRWCLKGLRETKESQSDESEETLCLWIQDMGVSRLAVDIPLSNPPCETCVLECPGQLICPVSAVRDARGNISDLLKSDFEIFEASPKDYERERLRSLEVDTGDNPFIVRASRRIISRALKKRLRKGLIPYWNRPIDIFLWSEYHDLLLRFFSSSYDSFGSVSTMLAAKMKYLRRHLPRELVLFESGPRIVLIELLRKKIVSVKNLVEFSNLEFEVQARAEILRRIEAEMNILLYRADLEFLIKNPRAFNSFLLALSVRQQADGHVSNLPAWARNEEARFLIPTF